MSVEFFQTVMGRKFYERDIPQLIKQLEKIGAELERSNDLKEGHNVPAELKRLADEIAEVEPALARLLREYIDCFRGHLK